MFVQRLTSDNNFTNTESKAIKKTVVVGLTFLDK
jgi:hypothetical protein